MQKIIIDTNVIVSALIGSGYSTQIIFDIVLGKKAIIAKAHGGSLKVNSKEGEGSDLLFSCH